MDYITELKKEYNNYLLRHMKACMYLEDEKVSIQDREKWLPEYKNILANLNRLLNQFELYNIEVSANEALASCRRYPRTKNLLNRRLKRKFKQ